MITAPSTTRPTANSATSPRRSTSSCNRFPNRIFLSGGDFTPRSLTTTNDYVGAFFANTTDLTKDLSLTFGGRWNYARIEIENQNPIAGEADKLTGTHEYLPLQSDHRRYVQAAARI